VTSRSSAKADDESESAPLRTSGLEGSLLLNFTLLIIPMNQHIVVL